MYVCFGIIIAADIVMLIRLMTASQYKLHRRQTNANLDLYTKNSRIMAEKFCFKTMLLLLIPFAFMMGYIDAMVSDMLFFAGFVNALVYIIILADFIKSSSDVKRKKKIHTERFNFLAAAKAEYDSFAPYLLNENAIILENLTDYMISSFSTGELNTSGVIFYDMQNELEPWLGSIPQYRYDIATYRYRIIIADCKQIADMDAFVRNIYNNFRHTASKYACLTIGLVNADTDINESNFNLGLAKDIKIVVFPSYKVLNLLSLIIGRIPAIRVTATSEETAEAQRIANIMVDDAKDITAINSKKAEIMAEYEDVLKQHSNAVPEPDINYVLMRLSLDKIGTERMKNIFMSYCSCFYLTNPERRLCDKLRIMGLTPEINPDNEYLYSIFKNIIFGPSEVKRIMAAFDYIDFMLRTVAIYYHVKLGGNVENFEIKSSFSDLSEQILSLSPQNNTVLRKVISFSSDTEIKMNEIFIKEYFNLISLTGNIDFCGLCHLIDIVRNKTRGHGSVKEENSLIIQSFLFFAVELLHDMLDIKNFNITTENNITFMGYRNEKYNCSEIIYSKDGLPCIPIRTQGDRKEYINFFKGRYIVPDFVKPE